MEQTHPSSSVLSARTRPKQSHARAAFLFGLGLPTTSDSFLDNLQPAAPVASVARVEPSAPPPPSSAYVAVAPA